MGCTLYPFGWSNFEPSALALKWFFCDLNVDAAVKEAGSQSCIGPVPVRREGSVPGNYTLYFSCSSLIPVGSLHK